MVRSRLILTFCSIVFYIACLTKASFSDSLTVALYHDDASTALHAYVDTGGGWARLTALNVANGAPGDSATCIQRNGTGGGTHVCRTDDEPFGVFPGGHLKFWVKAEAASHLVFSFSNATWGGSSIEWSSNPAPTVWTEVDIPLKGTNNVETLASLFFDSWSDGKKYWVDNIRIVYPRPADTVVDVGSGFNLNPVIEEGSADPSVHVFNGRIYIYPSHDASPNNTDWVMNNWKVYSTVDLNNITDHGMIVDDNDILWKGSWRNRCWAPDCNYYNGKYYFYFPIGWTSCIGVVWSTSPSGPFSMPLDTPLIRNAIDPSCFIDDDGTPYIIASGGGGGIGRLNPDMMSLAAPMQPFQLNATLGMTEGPFMFKRNNIYYLCYSHCGSSCPDVVAYATSNSVWGPYTGKGVIVAHGKTGNEHGSVFKYNDQWYVAYHNFAVHDMYRQTCFEYIHFKANGDIPQVYPTLLGVGKYYGYQRIQAENYFSKDSTANCIEGEGGFVMTGLNSNGWLSFPMVQFGMNQAQCTIRVASASGGNIEIHSDSVNGGLLANITVAATGGADVFATQTAAIASQSGQKNIYMVIKGSGSNIMKLDWFAFGGGTTVSAKNPSGETSGKKEAIAALRAIFKGAVCEFAISLKIIPNQPFCISIFNIDGKRLWTSTSMAANRLRNAQFSVPINAFSNWAGYVIINQGQTRIAGRFIIAK